MMVETSTRLEGEITVFSTTGRLTLGNALMQIERDLKRLIDSGARKLILDLTGLTFIDSAGVGTLVAIAGQMEAAGGQTKLAGASGSVERTFRIVHLDRVLDLRPSLQVALSAFAAGEPGPLRRAAGD